MTQDNREHSRHENQPHNMLQGRSHTKRENPNINDDYRNDDHVQSFTREEIAIKQRALAVEQDRLEKMIRVREIVSFGRDRDRIPSPLIATIRTALLSENILIPVNLDKYDGTNCLVGHQVRFESAMPGYGFNDHNHANALVGTFYGKAMNWWLELRPGSISSYQQLLEIFIHNFENYRTKKKPITFMANTVQ